jgi:hypothetical protein
MCATRGVFQIHQLVAQLPEQRFGKRNQLLAQRRYHRECLSFEIGHAKK